MRTLERITVTGYKSIRELRDFELGDVNVLIGANGTGKSNFLSVFKLLKSIFDRTLQVAVTNSGGADNLLYFGRKTTDEILLRLYFDTGRTFPPLHDNGQRRKEKGLYSIYLAPTQQESLQIVKEIGDIFIFPDYDPIPPVTFAEGKLETGIYESQQPFMPRLMNFLPTHGVFHFEDTGENAKVKQNADIYDNHKLKSDARNLASFLYLLKNHHQVYYKRILQTVQLAAPFFNDFVLNPMPENAQRIRLRWLHKNSEDDFDISQLSDGTLRFICLTTLLLQPNPPSLIIIDEPELGLHPAAIQLLIEMLRSAATHSQIIISTQSVEMVNHFLPEEIIVVDREKDESVFHRKSAKELEAWLDEYSMGELWQMNVIGGRP